LPENSTRNSGNNHGIFSARFFPRIAIVTIYGHNETMKSAKVSELKAKLSAYLADVRRGDTVVVYDRNTPIAHIVPFQENPDDLVIIEAAAAPSTLKHIRGVRPRKLINVDDLLRESRGTR
jgi:prevent-host-death family protein